MTSVYPQAVKVFTIKRNLLDDVDAGHVNDIQDEIVAIQTTLGPLVEVETDLLGGLTRDYGTVKRRLTEIQQGQHLPLAWAYNKTQSIKDRTDTALSLKKAIDPYGMISSAGIKLNESGWWQITMQASWDASNSGSRLIIGKANADELNRDHKLTSSFYNRLMNTSFSWTGYLAKNMVVTSQVYQSSGTTQKATDIQVTATCLRRLSASFTSSTLPY